MKNYSTFAVSIMFLLSLLFTSCGEQNTVVDSNKVVADNPPCVFFAPILDKNNVQLGEVKMTPGANGMSFEILGMSGNPTRISFYASKKPLKKVSEEKFKLTIQNPIFPFTTFFDWEQLKASEEDTFYMYLYFVTFNGNDYAIAIKNIYPCN